MKRLADQVFEYIASQSIDRVFLLPGGGAMHLVDAVSRINNLKYGAYKYDCPISHSLS